MTATRMHRDLEELERPESETKLSFITDILQSGMAIARDNLSDFALSPEFTAKMQLAFGEKIDATGLQAAWKKDDFSIIPDIEVRSQGELKGALGAYAKATNKIYLSQEYLLQNIGNSEAIATLLLEEIAHAIDVRLNVTDAAGDEGAIFSALVRGERLDAKQLQLLKVEDDTATIILYGQVVAIEQARIDGTDGDDILEGTSEDDSLRGYWGSDILRGGEGNDLLLGSRFHRNGASLSSPHEEYGNDKLYGGLGNDELYAYVRKNILEGGEGNDLYFIDINYVNTNNGVGGTIINDIGGTSDRLVIQDRFILQAEEWRNSIQGENHVQLTWGLQADTVGMVRSGTSVIVDINKDGVADADDDLSILNFYKPDGTRGSGYIENLPDEPEKTEGLDRWWATVGDDAIDVTWTVIVPESGDYDLDIDIDGLNSWELADNAEVTNKNSGNKSDFDFQGTADLGELNAGEIYEFLIPFKVPKTPVVEEITFQLELDEEDSLFDTIKEEFKALFVADRPEITKEEIRSDPEELIKKYAPILHFDKGSIQEDIPEEYGLALPHEGFTVPFRVESTWGENKPESITGDKNQEFRIDYQDGVDVPYKDEGAIYASVLKDKNPETDVEELAINYYFHYPRSNWKYYGGKNTHEGDWEGVTVFLTQQEGNWQPDRVAFAQHVSSALSDGGLTVPWRAIERYDEVSENFNVYVGLGAHASFPFRGITRFNTIGTTANTEVHKGDFATFIPSGKIHYLPRVENLELTDNDSSNDWLLYSGHWGKSDLYGEDEIGNTDGDDAPGGPIFLNLLYSLSDEVIDDLIGIGARNEIGKRWLNPWDWSKNFTSLENGNKEINTWADQIISLGTDSDDILESDEAGSILRGGKGNDTYYLTDDGGDIDGLDGSFIQDSGGNSDKLILIEEELFGSKEIEVYLQGLKKGKTGIDRVGSNLIIDTNQDGLAEVVTADNFDDDDSNDKFYEGINIHDVVILDFFDSDSSQAKQGTGFIEQVGNLTGQQILDFFNGVIEFQKQKEEFIEPFLEKLNINTKNIFSLQGQEETIRLKLKVQNRNTNFVNEMGIFKVDDDEGSINGIRPGQSGYQEAAIARSKTVFSILPDGLGFSNPERYLEFASGDRIGFFLIQDSTIDAVRSGRSSAPVIFSSIVNADRFGQAQITQQSDNLFALAWEDSNNGSFNDLIITLEVTEEIMPIGSTLQGGEQGELLDLTQFAGQQIEFVIPTIVSEAQYFNSVGFYAIDNSEGRVTDPLTGQQYNVGDEGYIKAAIRNSQESGKGMNFNERNSGITTQITGGSLFAPFIISNGTPEEILDNNNVGDPSVYFAFMGANSDGFDHIRLLGNNIFGFEDLPNGGDNDYNDIVFQVNLTAIG